MEVCRLYYWIKGAPENRPGGPWWYQDFRDKHYFGTASCQRAEFLKTVAPFLKDYKTYDGEDIPHTWENVHPPETIEGGEPPETA